MTTRYTYYLLAFFSIVMPTFQGSLGSSGTLVIVSSTMLISAFGCYTLRHIISHLLSHSLAFRVVSLCFCFYLIHIPLAMTLGLVIHEILPTERDFVEIYRPTLFVLLFWFCSAMFLNSVTKRDLLICMGLVFVFMVICSFLQAAKAAPWLIELYSKDMNVRSGRASAPFINPYDFGFVMSLFFYYFYANAVLGKWHHLIPAGLALFSILLTQSRTIAIGVAASCLLGSILMLDFKSILRARMSKSSLRIGLLLGGALVALVATYALLSERFPYLLTGLERLAAGERVNSLSVREQQFSLALVYADNPISLIFGNGPAKSVMEFVESIYTYQIFRYGVVGLILYFIVPWSFAVGALLFGLNRKKLRYDPMLLGVFLWLISIPIVSLGNNFTEQIRVSFVYLLVVSYLITFSRQKKVICTAKVTI